MEVVSLPRLEAYIASYLWVGISDLPSLGIYFSIHLSDEVMSYQRILSTSSDDS